MAARKHPGKRLRAFRMALNLSLREAANQLHCTHPTLKEWEEGDAPPGPAYRDAIEVWTHGDIKASDWPLVGREKEIAMRAGGVRAAEPKTPDESGEHSAIPPPRSGTA